MYKLYINILRFILNKANYIKYKDIIDYKQIKEYTPELYKLFNTVSKYYSDFPDKQEIPLDTFEMAVASYYPEHFERLAQAIKDIPVSVVFEEEHARTFLKKQENIQRLVSIVDVALPCVNDISRLNETTIQNLSSSLDLLKNNFAPVQVSDAQRGEVDKRDGYILWDNDLEKALRNEPGFRWSLDSLNKSLGSIRKGDFGFVVARPETGKTTFLASQVAFFALSLPPERESKLLWINNEERAEKVGARIKKALCSHRIRKSSSHLGTSCDGVEDTRILQNIILPKDIITTREEVESLCREWNPSLIVIDQLDKIRGFEGDRYDLELKEAYSWARKLGATYGPVIGVCQASGSAEGKKWIGMGDVDSSKTAKQGEADWILGIGCPDSESHVRYFYLPKNKLLGDEDTDPTRRHDKWTVQILPEEAIYEDF